MGNVNAIRGAFRPVSLGLLIAATMSACAAPPRPFPELPRLGVSTQLGSRNLCGMGISPAIALTGVPPATAQFKVRMTNTDVLFQEPWQATVPVGSPNGIAEGAIADYSAPCVGDMRMYSFYPYQTYRLEVMAVDGQQRPLAYGQVSFLVESVSTTLDRERAAQSRTATGTPAGRSPAAIGPAAMPDDYNTFGPQVGPVLMPRLPGPVPQP